MLTNLTSAVKSVHWHSYGVTILSIVKKKTNEQRFGVPESSHQMKQRKICINNILVVDPNLCRHLDCQRFTLILHNK